MQLESVNKKKEEDENWFLVRRSFEQILYIGGKLVGKLSLLNYSSSLVFKKKT